MDSIIDCLEHWAAVQPDVLFSSFLDLRGNTRESYAYGDFAERTRGLAESFCVDGGLKYGDRALLVYPPGLEGFAAFIACVRSGVIPVPAPAPAAIRSQSLMAKLNYIADDCRPAAVLTSTEIWRKNRLAGPSRIDTPGGDIPLLQTVPWIATDQLRRKASREFRNTPNSILFLQYTSGSTTDPKGVIVSHDNVIHNAHSTLDHVPIGVSWLPQYHDMGLIGYYLFPLVVGGTNFGLSPVDFLKRPLLWLETISRVGATYASSPNFGFEYCLREDRLPSLQLEGLKLGSLRVLMNASEPVNPRAWERFFERFAPCGLRKQAQVVAYGLAENTLAVSHYGRGEHALNRRLFRSGVVGFEDFRCSAGDSIRVVSCGKPLDGVDVRIVDPETAAPADKQIGEIWVAGKSVCEGYWNRPGLTREVFRNTIAGETPNGNEYLRTGDLGFLCDGELFVCGRIKDLIILHGVNYYPHDIESTVASVSSKIRANGVSAFGVPGAGLPDRNPHCDDGGETDALIVLVEVRASKDLPDAEEIAIAIRTAHSIEPHTLAFVSAGAISRTTSGKTARPLTRTRWLNGEIQAIATHTFGERKAIAAASGLREQLGNLLSPFITAEGDERTLAELGIDSLTLVMLVDGIERSIEERGASYIRKELDARVVQAMTAGEILSFVEHLEFAWHESIADTPSVLQRAKEQILAQEGEHMRSDAVLHSMARAARRNVRPVIADVLLTGPTGFFGPFLLESLLRHTSCTFHALTRAMDPAHGMQRIRAALRRSRLWTPQIDRELEKRLRVVCGDVALPRLGISMENWNALASRVQAVFHNAAAVNYVRNYDSVRPHNVEGTRELLRFAFSGIGKEFHYVSSTIIFGWSRKTLLVESDHNPEMSNLDFGYAQSKWVAEQLVLAAERQGLETRIYRPSFLSASTGGVGDKNDITVLLLAFMINHGIAVNARNQISFLPADIAANNIALLFRNRHAGTGPYHVTVDDYYSMMDITRVITHDYGRHFQYYELPEFVAEIRRRCTKDDPLYPLLYFVTEAHPKVAAMERKRYSNERYRAVRDHSAGSRDPGLRETVSYLMTYMLQAKLIDLKLAEAAI
jgi:thioester reductase-like protein